MKLLSAAIPAAAVLGYVMGVHADAPYFGPKAADFVSFASSSTTINAGQSIVLTTVPNNRRLVITDVSMQQVGGLGASNYLELEERDALGNVVVKMPETLLQTMFAYGHDTGHSDGHGIVFAPGSDVVWKLNLASVQPLSFAYFVNGYFTEK